MNTKYEYKVYIQGMNIKYEYKVWIQGMNKRYEYKVWIQNMNTRYKKYVLYTLGTFFCFTKGGGCGVGVNF